jgi:hypothetical protein
VTAVGLTVSVLGGIVLLLAAVAAVVAFLRANLAKTTIDTQRDTIVAFENRMAQLEADNNRLVTRVSAVEAENKMLRTIVTGVDELKQLRKEMAANLDKTSRVHDQMLTGIYSMHDLMLELLKRHVAPPGTPDAT